VSDNYPVFDISIHLTFRISYNKITFDFLQRMFNKIIANVVSVMPEKFVWLFSKRYIAGKKLSDAITVSQGLNKEGIMVTVDVLGEYINTLGEAEENKKAFMKTLDALHENKITGTISIKPTMFGLLIDKKYCTDTIRQVIKKAKEYGICVCMDMEDSACTDIELDMYEGLYNEFPANISLVLQAYLYRTTDDLNRLQKISRKGHPIDVRICKGIYVEKDDVAYQGKKQIRKNYLECLDYMLRNNFYCSIATHDKILISEAEKLLSEFNTNKDQYEFQMLYGVCPDLRKKLVQKGHPLRVYVPYGEQWFGYSTRRLKENPRMVTHIVKSLFVRG
jgi:proline dehydrogenase